MNPPNKRQLRRSMKRQDCRAASGPDTIRVLLDLLIPIAPGRGHWRRSLNNRTLHQGRGVSLPHSQVFQSDYSKQCSCRESAQRDNLTTKIYRRDAAHLSPEAFPPLSFFCSPYLEKSLPLPAV